MKRRDLNVLHTLGYTGRKETWVWGLDCVYPLWKCERVSIATTGRVWTWKRQNSSCHVTFSVLLLQVTRNLLWNQIPENIPIRIVRIQSYLSRNILHQYIVLSPDPHFRIHAKQWTCLIRHTHLSDVTRV
jgi:hypothetical protein